MTNFLNRLADQFTLAERSLGSAAAPSGRHPRRWRGRRTLIVALGVTVSGTGAALAATGVLSGGPVSIGQYQAGQRAPLAAVIPPAQAAAFAILRRPTNAADALPPSLLPAQFVGVYGADAALARHIEGLPAGVDVWVVPGSRSLCLVGNSGASCGPDATMIDHGLAMSSGSAGNPGAQSIIGLVPDGVGSVTLTLTDGSQRTVAVADNGYAATVQGTVARFAFIGPNGPVSIPG